MGIERSVEMTSVKTRVLAVVAFIGFVALPSGTFAQSDPRVGCYRADRPLGTSASADGVPGAIGERIGEAGPLLRMLATFRLLESGRVDRPGTVMRDRWRGGSHWVAAHDTLNVRLSTRTSGWDLRLVPVSDGDTVYIGEARYLSDVIVTDTGPSAWRPARVTVRVTREPCAPTT